MPDPLPKWAFRPFSEAEIFHFRQREALHVDRRTLDRSARHLQLLSNLGPTNAGHYLNAIASILKP
jgi:hypothetical protein